MATFLRFEGYSWILYLRWHRLLVFVRAYPTRTEALDAAKRIDGIG